MRKSTSPHRFKQEFNALVASIEAAKPAPEIRGAFARLRRLHADTKFATATDGIEAGRRVGVLKLLWALGLAPRARLERAA